MKSNRTVKPCSRSRAIERMAAAFKAGVTADSRTEAVIAAELEVGVSMLRKWCDAQTGARVPAFAFFILEPAALRVAMNAALDGTGNAVVELPTTGAASDCDLDAIERHQREASDVVSAGLKAAKRGHLDRAKAAELAGECDESIAATLAVREMARRAIREGVIAVSPNVRPGEA